MTYQLESRGPGVGVAATWSAGFVGLLWVFEIADAALGLRLDDEGIRPGSTDGLSGILFAPLLHGGFGHLISNTVPLLVLGFIVLLSGVSRWLVLTLIVWIVGGAGTWLFGGAGTVHIGASGLVFGWLAYLILRGFFTRHPWQIVVGVVVFLVYGGALWGVLPGQPGISWQGHMFGAVGGGLAAWWLADRGPRAVASFGR
ncbi:rhomboid family intramembrane serine protease [Nocardioides piscis]|uniref:Rhomboid family intramembrane serine protease n=1 Tax=Nocardioides piscis TaxID=2714938 RepID=A0A6G7YET7_9ACTN|nr:rhomboid family intramembrane serine protease [Nocardioides piscis]QIK75280.1 rhomboid family intramembrane serine protease [Nocardioides piscis]